MFAQTLHGIDSDGTTLTLRRVTLDRTPVGRFVAAQGQ